MALNIVTPDTNRANTSATAEAFLQAFQAYREWEDKDCSVDEPAHQLAIFAYEGGMDRMAVRHIDNSLQAALSALAAIARIDSILGGAYTCGGPEEVDPDLRAELGKVRDGLVCLWRFHDRNGGEGARDYARYVGAPARHDLVTWQDGR